MISLGLHPVEGFNEGVVGEAVLELKLAGGYVEDADLLGDG